MDAAHLRHLPIQEQHKEMTIEQTIRRALLIAGRGCRRAWGLDMRIRRGETRLNDIRDLAIFARCSLVFLLSGGDHEACNELQPVDAITKSIEHRGMDKHDFARRLGFQDFAYLRKQIVNGTVKVSMLKKMADALTMPIWQMLCDSESISTNDPEYTPTEWDQLVEKNLMGWL